MIAAVFDCVIYVQAALSENGPAFACLTLAEEEQITLYFTQDILDEVKQSLNSPVLRKKYKFLTDETIESFLGKVITIGTLVQNPPAAFSLERDPKDEPYLNLAIEAGTPFLVTRDKDMLDLMKDDKFRKAYPWLTIIEPVPFLNHARAEIAKQLGD